MYVVVLYDYLGRRMNKRLMVVDAFFLVLKSRRVVTGALPIL